MPRPETQVDVTVATYALFGMTNWIYNWYDPRGQLDVTELVANVMRLFLNGFAGPGRFDEQASTTPERAESLNIWRASPPPS